MVAWTGERELIHRTRTGLAGANETSRPHIPFRLRAPRPWAGAAPVPAVRWLTEGTMGG